MRGRWAWAGGCFPPRGMRSRELRVPSSQCHLSASPDGLHVLIWTLGDISTCDSERSRSCAVNVRGRVSPACLPWPCPCPVGGQVPREEGPPWEGSSFSSASVFLPVKWGSHLAFTRSGCGLRVYTCLTGESVGIKGWALLCLLRDYCAVGGLGSPGGGQTGAGGSDLAGPGP